MVLDKVMDLSALDYTEDKKIADMIYNFLIEKGYFINFGENGTQVFVVKEGQDCKDNYQTSKDNITKRTHECLIRSVPISMPSQQQFDESNLIYNNQFNYKLSFRIDIITLVKNYYDIILNEDDNDCYKFNLKLREEIDIDQFNSYINANEIDLSRKVDSFTSDYFNYLNPYRNNTNTLYYYDDDSHIYYKWKFQIGDILEFDFLAFNKEIDIKIINQILNICLKLIKETYYTNFGYDKDLNIYFKNELVQSEIIRSRS